MAEFIKVNGKRTNSTEKESTLGRMEGNTMVIMKTTKSMGSELILGLTVNLTRANGQTANSTVKPDSQTLKAGVKWAFGRTARESSGLMPNLPSSQNHQMQLVAP